MAGSDAANPQVRVRIIPDERTVAHIDARLAGIAAKKERERLAREARIAAEARERSGIQEGDGGEVEVEEEKNSDAFVEGGIAVNVDVIGSEVAKLSSDAPVLELNDINKNEVGIRPVEGVILNGELFSAPEKIDTQGEGGNEFQLPHELRFSESRCWLSRSLKLWPGEYRVFADISFDQPLEKLFQLRQPADGVGEKNPWMDSIDTSKNNLLLQVSSSGLFEVKGALPSAFDKILAEAQQRERPSTGSTQEHSRPGTKDSSRPISRSTIAARQDESRVGNVTVGGDVIATASTIDKIETDVIVAVQEDGRNVETLDCVKVMPERWPFMSEVQEEVCSRGLMLMMNEMRDEAHILGAKFVGLLRDVQEARKKWD